MWIYFVKGINVVDEHCMFWFVQQEISRDGLAQGRTAV